MPRGKLHLLPLSLVALLISADASAQGNAVPECSTVKNPGKIKPAILTLHADGHMTWFDTGIDHEQLADHLYVLAHTKPRQGLLLRIAAKARYGEVAQVLADTQWQDVETAWCTLK